MVDQTLMYKFDDNANHLGLSQCMHIVYVGIEFKRTFFFST